MRRRRVLMLGWEFPPAINGGLGVACYGLAKALAEHVDLRVLVPLSDSGSAEERFDLQGANEFEAGNLAASDEDYSYQSFAEVENIPVSLDPYATDSAALGDQLQTNEDRSHFSRSSDAELSVFRKNGDLYGCDLGVKVVEFSKLAVKVALQNDFDVIHAHDWMTFLAGIEVKKATGEPLVVHLHATQYDRAGPDVRDWIFELEKRALQEADRIIAVSSYAASIITDHYAISSQKVEVVHNGVQPAQSYRSRKRFPEKLVLFLGRLTAQKGPELFLEIASKVLAEEPAVRFVMAGEGEQLRELIETGAFMGLGGRFHFTGFLNKDRVHEVLSMTDVYCMPSVSEPFGLSALEAAQFGIPAVLSRQSGVAEVLSGSLQADHCNTDEMARLIVALLRDPALRKKVRAEARESLKAATWEAAAEKVLHVYRAAGA